MRHATCRRHLRDGRRDTAVERHLVACPSCTSFADRLDAVDRLAPTLASEVPPGLADRAVDGVHSRAEEPIIPLSAAGLTGTTVTPIRRPIATIAAVAASIALIVGVVAALDNGAGDTSLETAQPAALLSAATEALEGTETYRFEIEGSASYQVRFAELELPRPRLPGDLEMPDFERPEIELPGFPTFEGQPPEMREEMRRQLEEAEARLRRSLEEIRGQAEPGEQLRRQLEDAQRQFESLVPDELDIAFDFSGAGEVDQPDRARVTGTIDTEGSGSGLFVPDDLAVEVRVVGSETFVSTGEGDWIRLEHGNTPLPAAVLDPRAAFDRFAEPVGPVEDLGIETLDDVQVRHVRFEPAAPTSDRRPHVEVTIDVWIDDDDRIRQVRTRSSHIPGGEPPVPGLSFSTDLTISLFDFGTAVDIEPPPADQVRDGDFPFGFGFDFDSSGN